MESEEDRANTIDYCLEVKKTIEGILRKMNILYEEVEVFKGLSSSGPKFIVRSQESGLLIGHRGENLRAFSHLARKIVFKNSGLAKFMVDVNNYQEENTKKIRNQAVSAAQKAKSSKQSVELDPMSSYERMLIHSLFSQDPEIVTESIGEREERRIIIKLKTPNS